jgi:hypothetical protein
VKDLQQGIQNGFDMNRTTRGVFFSGRLNSNCVDVYLKVDTFCLQYFFLLFWRSFAFRRFGSKIFAHPVYNLQHLKIQDAYTLLEDFLTP